MKRGIRVYLGKINFKSIGMGIEVISFRRNYDNFERNENELTAPYLFP